MKSCSKNPDNFPYQSVDHGTVARDHERKMPIASKWTKFHLSAFFITFYSNVLLHIIRKSFSNVKKTISDVWSPFNTSFPEIYNDVQWNDHQLFPTSHDASIFLGTLDTVYMISHALGLFVSGTIGDRFDLRKVLSFGICSSAVTVLFFGYVSEVLQIYNTYWYITFWCLTGLLQSTEWPAAIAVVGKWFGKSRRGLIMGIWAASPAIGNVLGSYITAAVLHYGYQFAFVVPSGIALSGGIIVFFSLVSSPREIGLLEEIEDNSNERENISKNSAASDHQSAIGFFQAIRLPGVIPYSLSYAFMKFLHVSFMFWLPYYLQNIYGWEEAKAVRLSIWYDVGGILGAVCVGFISDQMSSRSPAIAVTLLFTPGVLLALSKTTPKIGTLSFLLTMTGLCINGVASLMCTTIAADLGRQKQIQRNREAMATVTGIIDGVGSIGAAIGQQIIPIIQKSLGWSFIFYLFMMLTGASLVCISKIIYHDFRRLWLQWKSNHGEDEPI